LQEGELWKEAVLWLQEEVWWLQEGESWKEEAW
jgi:hypothetical protein